MTDDKLRERLLRKQHSADQWVVPFDEPINHDGPEAVAELDRLEAENARKSALLEQLAEALDEISQEGVAPETVPSDKARGDYWAKEAIKCRNIARQALATYRESVK